MIDPTIARARIEIASDQALIKKLTSDDLESGRRPSSQTRARLASLKRLIAANEALVKRSKS